MHVTSYGGVREVTGSMHLLSVDSQKILLDCGMFQGRRKESAEKNRVFPIDPRIITNMVLSHAHIDHSGRIPLLTKKNFTGRVVCTRVTQAACEYLLLDAAHIQESDAQYLNYKRVRSFLQGLRTSKKTGTLPSAEAKKIQKLLRTEEGKLDHGAIKRLMAQNRLEEVTPLYTIKDAEEALGYFDGYPYRYPVTVADNVTATFYDAGHILGSAITMIEAKENGRTATICYSGDLGRFGKPILEDPTLRFGEKPVSIDLLIMESTYGNRFHEPVADVPGKLKQVIRDTVARGGSIVIPAFAFGRTQELIYMLHELYDAGEVPKIPIYIDSPLSNKLTQVFGEHAEVYDRDARETFLEKGKNPFAFDQLHYISTVEESMALMRDETPHIVISASGMCEAGRILHHLRYKIHNPKNTILMVGFMAEHTLGRRIMDLAAQTKPGDRSASPEVRILDKIYPLKAQVASIGGFSGHADRSEMMKFLKESNLEIKKIAVVHGEEEQTLAFADFLRNEGFQTVVPRAGEAIHF